MCFLRLEILKVFVCFFFDRELWLKGDIEVCGVNKYINGVFFVFVCNVFGGVNVFYFVNDYFYIISL